MKVKDLIEKLKEFDQEMEVMTGCSCAGHELDDVIIKAHFKRVYNKNDFKGETLNLGDKVWLV